MDGMQQQIIELTQRIHKLEQHVVDLEQENKELKEKITELENKLRQYENPHTPSSRQRFKGNIGRNNISSGKHGGVVGHQGATRHIPKPDEIIPVTADNCPRCGSFLGDPIDVESRTIEEIP
ncbi:MAG: IS66 family transposase, partial [Candidatus Thermoplasmatota archaeon]